MRASNSLQAYEQNDSQNNFLAHKRNDSIKNDMIRQKMVS